MDFSINDYLASAFSTVKTQINGLLSAILIDVKGGYTIYSGAPNPSYDMSSSGVFLLETYKQAQKSVELEAGRPRMVYEILITSGDILYVLITSGNGYLGIVAIDSRISNLGLCRAVLRRLASEMDAKFKEMGMS